MRFFELLVLRLTLFVGLPVLLLALAVGPKRLWRHVKFGWRWLFKRRLDPEEILTQVVSQHEQHVVAVRHMLDQAEAAEAGILRNLQTSENNVATLDAEAQAAVKTGDELGARAALYKLNLERLAIDGFRQQLGRQRELITESRRRLYLLDLQLRQFEVGRSILLCQLAEAEKVEQQYAIANQFDPFNAIANWKQAEGLVQEKAINARAIERVYVDTAEAATEAQPAQVDTRVLEAQLAELRARCEPAAANNRLPPPANHEPSQHRKNELEDRS